MFSKYYQSELSYLRDLGREFGRVFPVSAEQLADKSTDPDVERLLEGFAFLAARVRERLDDDVPEIIHTLTDLVLPHYLRPVPACSIVEFTPPPGSLRTRQKIARGAELAANASEGTACRFRTTSDVDLLPLRIENASLDMATPSTPALKLQFQTQDPGRHEVFKPAGVRLFIHHAQANDSTTLFLWLMRYVKSVTLRGRSQNGRTVELGKRVVRPAGFDPECALLPWPRFGPGGYRLLQEYFVLPSKFLFFDIRGFDALATAAEDSFEVIIRFERPPGLAPSVNRDNLKLHCTPVVNLFPNDADPIKVDPLEDEYLLRATEIDPRHMEVYSVDKVTGFQSGRATRRDYKSFFDFLYAESPEEVPAYYRVRRTRSAMADGEFDKKVRSRSQSADKEYRGLDTFLSVHTPRDIASAPVEETLTIELMVTNRRLADRLGVGAISKFIPGSAPLPPFRNILPTTDSSLPPLGQELHWRLMSHMAINYRSLVDAEAMRAVLDLYNFQTLVDDQAARANKQRIDAIRGVSTRPIERLVKGVPVRGIGATLELDQGKLESEGNLFLFASIIDEVLASHTAINTFSELKVKAFPSQAEYQWTAKSGRQAIL